MQGHPRRGSKWRHFTRKNRVLLFVAFFTAVALAVVSLLMYMLTSMKWRTPY